LLTAVFVLPSCSLGALELESMTLKFKLDDKKQPVKVEHEEHLGTTVLHLYSCRGGAVVLALFPFCCCAVPFCWAGAASMSCLSASLALRCSQMQL
jgi:hypothetical protein